jgi:hypothetical protein
MKRPYSQRHVSCCGKPRRNNDATDHYPLRGAVYMSTPITRRHQEAKRDELFKKHGYQAFDYNE